MMTKLCVYFLFAATLLTVDPARAVEPTAPTTKTAVFAGGCFWCIQPAFDKAKGVIQTVVGYSGGTEPNPTYELVTSEKTQYRESIELTYDPTKISYDQLLDIYWRQIDPTQADGQFTDIGPSYRAAIFYSNGEEKKIAEASKAKLARSGKFNKPIVTAILPAMKFYPAEAHHQKYYQQNPEHFEAFEEGSGRTSFKKENLERIKALKIQRSTPNIQFHRACHSERSEESLIIPGPILRGKRTEMFRFAQHDSVINDEV